MFYPTYLNFILLTEKREKNVFTFSQFVDLVKSKDFDEIERRYLSISLVLVIPLFAITSYLIVCLPIHTSLGYHSIIFVLHVLSGIFSFPVEKLSVLLILSSFPYKCGVGCKYNHVFDTACRSDNEDSFRFSDRYILVALSAFFIYRFYAVPTTYVMTMG